jgi:hypothetical protein
MEILIVIGIIILVLFGRPSVAHRTGLSGVEQGGSSCLGGHAVRNCGGYFPVQAV